MKRHEEIERVYVGSSWIKRHEFFTYPSVDIYRNIHTTIPNSNSRILV